MDPCQRCIAMKPFMVGLTSTFGSEATLVFISVSRRHISCAACFPSLSPGCRKKFTPRSAPLTIASSSSTNEPIPGRTRFLRICADSADAPMTRMRDFSSEDCPEEAQSRSWRSYRCVCAEGRSLVMEESVCGSGSVPMLDILTGPR